ncbi:MAG: hypothetical protein ABSG07_14375 [Terriglobales bacterium]|jgi:hypothetical protein
MIEIYPPSPQRKNFRQSASGQNIFRHFPSILRRHMLVEASLGNGEQPD